VSKCFLALLHPSPLFTSYRNNEESPMILRTKSIDARFPLPPGVGTDAVHRDPIYSYAATLLESSSGHVGVGLTFTLGDGNDLVCQAAEHISQSLLGRNIEEVMSELGTWQKGMADEPRYRWLGPHKGVVHLALASVTNACWDLLAKERGMALWQLLLDLGPEQVVNTLDMSYIEDVLTREAALEFLRQQLPERAARESNLQNHYPAYDTSAGWLGYDDEEVKANCNLALETGFRAIKLKVGSTDMNRDLRRLALTREAIGPNVKLMVDANQRWSLPQALQFCRRAKEFDLYWIEEPTHPDILAHKKLSGKIAPIRIAAGEHIPNRIMFKNFFQTGCLDFCQVDALRVAGVSEFIVVSLMARQFDVPVVPHVGDMGQLHQHLVVFNHVAVGHEVMFLEHIPHLRQHFVTPCRIQDGAYVLPEEPGASCDISDQAILDAKTSKRLEPVES